MNHREFDKLDSKAINQFSPFKKCLGDILHNTSPELFAVWAGEQAAMNELSEIANFIKGNMVHVAHQLVGPKLSKPSDTWDTYAIPKAMTELDGQIQANHFFQISQPIVSDLPEHTSVLIYFNDYGPASSSHPQDQPMQGVYYGLSNVELVNNPMHHVLHLGTCGHNVSFPIERKLAPV